MPQAFGPVLLTRGVNGSCDANRNRMKAESNALAAASNGEEMGVGPGATGTPLNECKRYLRTLGEFT
ncbi:MAG: hypothetical protein GYA39_02340 [Methanothrix sp.]|nr:hypothetical protein [Methanothrix sp.]